MAERAIKPLPQHSEPNNYASTIIGTGTEANNIAKPKIQKPDEYRNFAIIQDAPLDRQILEFIDQLKEIDPLTKITSPDIVPAAKVIERTKLRLPVRQLPKRKYRFASYPDHQILTDLQLPLAIFNTQQQEATPILAQKWQWFGHRLLIALHPNARWSDNEKLVPMDLITAFVKTQRHNNSNRFNEPYSIDKIEIYTDTVLSIYFKPDVQITPEFQRKILSIKPASHLFFKNLTTTGNSEKYNQLLEPTTGPYEITRSLFDQSKLNLTLKKSWWGRQLKVYKQRFNIQKLQYVEIKDSPFQAFLGTQLDIIPVLTSSSNTNLINLFQQSKVDARIFNSDCHIPAYRMKIVRSVIRTNSASVIDSQGYQPKDPQPSSAAREAKPVLYYSDPVLIPTIRQFLSGYQQSVTPQQVSSIELTKLLSNKQQHLVAFVEPIDSPLMLDQQSFQTLFDHAYPSPSWLAWSWIELPYQINSPQPAIGYNLPQLNSVGISMDPINPVHGGYLRLNAKKKTQVLANMRRRQYKHASKESKTINNDQQKENALWGC